MRLIQFSEQNGCRSAGQRLRAGGRVRLSVAAAALMTALLASGCSTSGTGIASYQGNLGAGCRVTATATICPGGRVVQ